MQLTSTADAERTDEAIIVDSLRWIVHGLRVTAYDASRDVGLSGAQLFVLRELAAEPGISIRRLSERTLTDPSSVSVVVARLVERGLVERRADADDGRRSVLLLSSRGSKIVTKAPAPYQARLIEALRSLPKAKLRQLRITLSQVVEVLGEGTSAAPMFFANEEASPRRPTKRPATARRPSRKVSRRAS